MIKFSLEEQFERAEASGEVVVCVCEWGLLKVGNLDLIEFSIKSHMLASLYQIFTLEFFDILLSFQGI